MFTLALDAILMFMVATPFVGLVLGRRSHLKRSRVLPIFSAVGLLVGSFFLYQLLGEAESGAILVGRSSFGAHLHVDQFSIFMGFLYVAVGLVAIIYSSKFMERDSGLAMYYTLVLGMVAGMVGVVFSGDFLTLFVFWELMSITSYALVAFRKRRWESIEAGFKYLVMSGAGSATILLAMSFLYGMTGTLNFVQLSASLSTTTTDIWLYIPLLLTIVGFGIKAAIVPFHMWLPDAHSAAPSPISAILSAVMVPTAACILVRTLLVVFGFAQNAWLATLAFLAVLTMFGGNMIALLQNDIKRLLAVSTIANVGYILFGFSTASHEGFTASMFHILNHAIAKTLLFLCAGAFYRATRTRDLRKLKGIGRTMPITGVSFAVGSIALAAFPPLNGFWSEWMIVAAGVRAEMILLSVVVLGNMALSVVYYIRLLRIVVLDRTTRVSRKASEASFAMVAPILCLAFICVFIGVYPGPFIEISSRAANALFGVEGYVSSILGGP